MLQAISLDSLPCTHKSSNLASTGFDPPQPPLKKGEPDSKSPFFKGDLGGSPAIINLENYDEFMDLAEAECSSMKARRCCQLSNTK